jgi:hypothetical protein
VYISPIVEKDSKEESKKIAKGKKKNEVENTIGSVLLKEEKVMFGCLDEIIDIRHLGPGKSFLE